MGIFRFHAAAAVESIATSFTLLILSGLCVISSLLLIIGVCVVSLALLFIHYHLLLKARVSAKSLVKTLIPYPCAQEIS